MIIFFAFSISMCEGITCQTLSRLCKFHISNIIVLLCFEVLFESMCQINEINLSHWSIACVVFELLYREEFWSSLKYNDWAMRYI